MTDVYLALLGVEFTIAVFLAGGIAAVAQVVASQVSPHATRLIWRSLSLVAGSILLFVSTIWSLTAATIQAGGIAEPTSPVGSAGVAFATGVAVALSVALLGWSLVSAVRLLDPFRTLDRLPRRDDAQAWAEFVVGSRATTDLDSTDLSKAAAGLGLDPVVVFLGDRMVGGSPTGIEEPPSSNENDAVADGNEFDIFRQRVGVRRRIRQQEIGELNEEYRSGRVGDPLTASFELAERALLTESADRFERLFGMVVDRGLALSSRASLAAVTPAELQRLECRGLFDDHIQPLMRSALDSSRVGHAARISRVVAVRGRSGTSPDIHAASLVVVHGLARVLVDPPLAQPLCSTIQDLCELGLSAAAMNDPLGEHRFDEVCRGLGELGQRIPRAFHSPNDPEITIGPHAEILAPAVPLGELLHSTWTIKERLFKEPPGEFSPLIWCDAVKVTAREIGRYSRDVLRSDHLEGHLLNAVDQLYDIALAGAKAGDDRWTMFGGYALAELAREAQSPIWREYHTHLGIRLVEIAIFANDRRVTSVGMGGELVGDRLAKTVLEGLPSSIAYVTEQISHGRFDEASNEANEGVLRALGA